MQLGLCLSSRWVRNDCTYGHQLWYTWRLWSSLV